MTNRIIVFKNLFKSNFKKKVSLCLCLIFISIGFVFGQKADVRQTADEGNLELVVQTGHSDKVTSVKYSPDGKILASGSWDNTIKLWNAETGQLIKTLRDHTNTVNTLEFSPDGEILASGSGDKTIKLWNAKTGQLIATLAGHLHWVRSVAFSPDGKMLASGGEDNTIKLWNIETKQLIKSIKRDGLGMSVAFSPNGKILASGNWDKTIKLWNVETGLLINTLMLKKNSALKTDNNIDDEVAHPVNSVAFSPDGKILASANWDDTARLWNVETGQLIETLKKTNSPDLDEEDSPNLYSNSVVFSPDGKMLGFGSGLEIILWDWQRRQIIKAPIKTEKKVNAVSFSPDGKTLVSGGNDAQIKFWSVDNRQIKKSLIGNSNWINSVVISPNGKILASGNYDKSIGLWNLEAGQQIKSIDAQTEVLSSAFSPDGKILAWVGFDSIVRLLNIETLLPIKTLKSQNDEDSTDCAVTFSPDGKKIASAGNSNSIKLWNVETSQLTKSIQVFENNSDENRVYTLAFSPDGRILVSGDNEAIKFWNTETGQLIKSIKDDHSIRSVVFSNDGKTIAAGGGDKLVKLWNVESGKLIKSFNGHDRLVTSVAFSPDGKSIISGGWDNKVKLWSVDTGQIIKDLNGHINWVWSVVFSPDSKFIISGGSDTTLKIWNKEKGKNIATLISVGNKDWVIISPDGRFDASDGALKLMHYAYGLEVINLDQLKEAYYEPGLLQKLLGYSKEPLRPIVPLKDVKLYPEIIEQKFDEQSRKLTVKLKNRGGGIGETRVLVNESVVVADARDGQTKANPNIPADAVVTFTVDLPKESFLEGKENKITVVTSNYLKEIGKGNIQSRGSDVVYLDKGEEEKDLPSLYAIVGGVSDYEGEQIDLRFAAKDAEDFSNALKLGANRLFCPDQRKECLGKVNITTLSTNRQKPEEQPTKENFRKVFAEVAKKAKPEDIIVVYLSGHGVTLGTGTDTYFYLTKEARSALKNSLETNFQTVAISNEELTDWLTPNQGKADDIWIKAQKRVLILDTCAAGNFDQKDNWRADRDLSGDQIRAMDFLKGKTGTFIMMGSSANQPSYESNNYGQGLLTFALLEGMKGLALQKATGNIDVRILLDYAEKRVPELGKSLSLEQRPIIKQPSGNTFVIGQMSEAEKQKIKLPQPKPMLLRPLLTNPETGDDDLKLIPELRKRLDTDSSFEAVKRSGKDEPLLVFVDDDNFPGGIRVTGTYSVEGETIRVKAFLRKDGKTIVTLPEITDKKEDLVNKLLFAIYAELEKIK